MVFIPYQYNINSESIVSTNKDPKIDDFLIFPTLMIFNVFSLIVSHIFIKFVPISLNFYRISK